MWLNGAGRQALQLAFDADSTASGGFHGISRGNDSGFPAKIGPQVQNTMNNSGPKNDALGCTRGNKWPTSSSAKSEFEGDGLRLVGATS